MELGTPNYGRDLGVQGGDLGVRRWILNGSERGPRTLDERTGITCLKYRTDDNRSKARSTTPIRSKVNREPRGNDPDVSTIPKGTTYGY